MKGAHSVLSCNIPLAWEPGCAEQLFSHQKGLQQLSHPGNTFVTA
jgi:hypothetical protein